MLEIKIFSTIGSFPKFEDEINRWLAQHPKIVIEKIVQSQSCESKADIALLTISILYRTK